MRLLNHQECDPLEIVQARDCIHQRCGVWPGEGCAPIAGDGLLLDWILGGLVRAQMHLEWVSPFAFLGTFGPERGGDL